MRTRLGFIVNPIAGMGGVVGLKGTDGAVLAEARKLGAEPHAPERAVQALSALAADRKDIELLTASGAMGEEEARTTGFGYSIVHHSAGKETSAADTVAAVAALHGNGAELILFAGGDGTARDIFSVAGPRLPILGIPSGVKMHSGVFAASPRSASRLVSAFLRSGETILRKTEIVDSSDLPGAINLFGYALTPHAPLLLPAAKSVTRVADEEELAAACREVATLVAKDACAIVGPGTTTLHVKQALGGGTLLGTDAYRRGLLTGRDLKASELLQLVTDSSARIVVGVTGGQGCLFGRGNQQISPDVIRAVGRDRILVVASLSKLLALPQRSMFVDTGAEDVDRMLCGYIPVITGVRQSTPCKVVVPS